MYLAHPADVRSVDPGSGGGLFPGDAPGIDLSGFVLFLQRRWKVIAGTALLVAVLTALALLQATPLYSATASVAVQSQKTKVVDIQDVVSGLSPDQATMETQASILRSRRLAGLLIDRLRLDQVAEFDPPQRRFALLKPATWFGGATPLSPDEARAKIVGRVVDRTEVAIVPRSYVMTVTTTARSPALAADMANALADLYITDGIAAKYEATKKASAYLQRSVDDLRAQTVATDRVAEGFRARAGLAGSDEGTTIAGQQMSEINSQLVAARAERAAKEAQLAQLRRLQGGGGDGGVEASGAALSSPLVQRLREQEGEVVRKLGELRATYGERHPKILNAEAELRDLRAKIGDEVGRTASLTANELAIARAREATLAASLARVQGAVAAGGTAGVRLRELQRESDANRTIYETFLNRLKETNQQGDLQQADARIVSNADLPLAASFPRVRETLLGAIVLGLIAGGALALALERLDTTIRSANLLEALGGGATLAFVPTVARGIDPPESIVLERPDAMVPEALRTLRSALALADADRPPQLVLLSSSVPSEGKTFVGVGLARVAAQAGVRTLLIDGDMRHPRVHKALGIDNDAGLVEVLGGQATLDDAIRRDEPTGLDVLIAGTGAVNPPDLLRSERMAQLLRTVRERFDFVVIDSPPFAPLTDSQILAGMADKLILVVRWGDTPLPVVQTTLRQIRRIGAPLAGSVLSQVDVDRHAQYGYGDHGYHYAKYRSYYGAAR